MRSTALVLGALLLVAGCSSPDAPPPGRPTSEPAPSLRAASPAAATAPPAPPVPVVDAGLGATPVVVPAPPVRITVPAIGVDLPVDPVGVAGDGQLALPDTAARAGWYEFGSAPDSTAGTTTIAAHVDSRVSGLGSFSRLRNLAPGAEVDVTTADGGAHRYQVTDVARVAKRGAPVDRWFDRTGPARLVLVTCGGTFDRGTGHYRDNVVVTAEPVG